MKTQTNADQFLASNGIKLSATLSNSKTAPWSDDGQDRNHYRITLSRPSIPAWKAANQCGCPRITFDFWDSIANSEQGKAPAAYDVFACIGGDVNCPDTFQDFCAEYGYDSDSLKALKTFKRCSAFAKRLREFFTSAELEQLAEIQ